MTRAIRYEYKRLGRGVTVYREWLVLDRPDVKVLLLDAYEGAEVRHAGRVLLDAGAPIVWFVFPETWHDVGRFHRADGTFTGWYTNVATPVEMRDDTWTASDLFLDHWLPAEGHGVWLDEDDFRDAARSGRLDAATRRRVLNERALIELALARGAWPPPIARDIDLAQARALRDA